MADLMKSLSNLIRQKKDQLAKLMTDPVTNGKYAIEESENVISEFTSRVAKLIAETRQLERRRKDAEDDSKKYMAIARHAAENGNEDDARQAVIMKNKAAEREEELVKEIKKNEELTDNLRKQLASARVKVADAKSNLTRLSARMEGAKVRQDLAKAATSFSGSASPLAALDDLQKVVETHEAEAEAWEEIAGTEDKEEGKDLEEKYLDESTDEVDAEVEALMKEAKKK